MFKSEVKHARKNYMRYVAIFFGVQSIALLVLLIEFTKSAENGVPLEHLSLLDQGLSTMMIAFLIMVFTSIFVVFFSIKDLQMVVKKRGMVKQQRMYRLLIIGMSVLMVVLFARYLLPA